MTDARVSFVARAQSFHDVDALLMNYFTFRALKETLSQMQETDFQVRAEFGRRGALFRGRRRERRVAAVFSTLARARAKTFA